MGASTPWPTRTGATSSVARRVRAPSRLGRGKASLTRIRSSGWFPRTPSGRVPRRANGGAMRENRVKRALAGGGVALGTLVMEFPTTGIARLAAGAGADFVVFDLEHTGWSLETLRTLLAAARAAEVVPLVRVPATEYHFIARALDVG